MKDSFLIHLNQLDSSYLILLLVAGVGFAVAILFYTGLFGWALGWLGHIVRGSIRQGFLLWERLFAWASWPLFLAIVLGLLAVGWAAAGCLPALTVVCSLAPLFMGLTACLAYMFIDLERYEVERWKRNPNLESSTPRSRSPWWWLARSTHRTCFPRSEPYN